MMAFTNTVTLSLVRIWEQHFIYSEVNRIKTLLIRYLICGHLLRRDIVGDRPHVDLLVDVEAGDDEEDPGPPGAARHQATQPEDDCSLVLLQQEEQ